MKITVILKDFTEQFFTGFGEIIGFNTRTNAEKFEYCKKLHNERRASMKIGTGQFRDAVELNQMIRGKHSIAYKLEPRRGYKLATFEITTN
jgi:hypothetical protein